MSNQNASLPPPGTGGNESNHSGQTKSFASEMSKNKQKFLML
jgi:hypothetical protein